MHVCVTSLINVAQRCDAWGHFRAFSFLPVPAVPQVIGIDMKSDAPPYKVYDTVESYSDGRQRLNMLTYTGVSGLVTCS